MEYLPEEFSTEELVDRLLLNQEIEQELDDVKNGRVLTNEESEAYVKSKWKSY